VITGDMLALWFSCYYSCFTLRCSAFRILSKSSYSDWWRP